MNEPQEQFEDIAQLLRLKRHEHPPPGYLNRLPDHIRARIELESHSRAAAPGWWRTLIAIPVRLAFGACAAAALLFAASLLLPDGPDAPLVPLAGVNATPVAPNPTEPLGIPATELVAGGAPASPLTPVMAPDTAPAGLFNPAGFLAVSNSPGAARVNFSNPQ